MTASDMSDARPRQEAGITQKTQFSHHQRSSAPAHPSGVTDALALAALGWHVFPLRVEDKRPAVSAWPTRATTDPERITRAWSHGPYGVGIACGPSGLVVVDLDVAKGDQPPAEWALPGVVDGRDVFAALCERHGEVLPFGRSPVALTGSGGLHLYYRAPADREVRNSAGRIGWKIDVRAVGGYVVAPPTTVYRRTYRWAGGSPGNTLTPLPDWLADLAAPVVELAAAAVRPLTVRGYSAAALRREVETVLRARPGTRNDTLHRAAFSLGTLTGCGVLPADAVEFALKEAAASIDLGPAEAIRTIASGLAAGANHPRRVAV
ncbi:bifunctional DNA primase/polymerase [Streptomyces sp. NPDC020807]|uniref:bifunctional DNA primase/polymerase n=1 Tax=Streptomyces sp. NPDC020807 TaxID=3155119 RepID=UPI0033E47510